MSVLTQPDSAQQQEALLRTLLKVADLLRANGIPFTVVDGCAAAVRGGPPAEHGVDVLVCERDVSHAAGALAAAGMQPVTVRRPGVATLHDGPREVSLAYQRG